MNNNRFNNQYSSSSSLNDSSFRNSSLNQSNLNETADYDDDDSASRHSSSTKLESSKFYREITLEMIDDFLNPLSKNKPKEHKPQIACFLPSATKGRGLTEEYLSENNLAKGESTTSLRSSTTTNDENNSYSFRNTDNYLPFALRENNENNFAYINKLRAKYEKKLMDQAESEKHNQADTSIIKDEASSVVGSSMSQIESVSAMSVSTIKKQHLLRRVNMLDNMQIDEEDEFNISFDINQNKVIPKNVKNLLDSSNQDSEDILDESIIRQQIRDLHLQELITNYVVRDDYDPNLPVTSKREEIISHIENSRGVCILQGGTGCGKTTQVPQYILDHYMKKRDYCNIIVTQPRRIAAISVARRVCQERNWDFGKLCGYQIGLDRSRVSEDTRITYCTTGVLLQKLINDKSGRIFDEHYTHIILDEVHERDLDTDFVMLMIKLKSFGKLKCKIVLMSATINMALFREYFATRVPRNLTGLNSTLLAPVLEIKSKHFNVTEFYWEDLTANSSFLSPVLNQIFREKADRYKNKSFNDSARNYISQLNFNRRAQFQTYESLKNMKFQMQNIIFKKEEPQMYDECMIGVIALLKYFDEQEIKALRSSKQDDSDESDSDFDVVDVKKLNNKLRIINGLPEARGSVLIFVPGMEQIKQLQDLIAEELPNDKLNILPLHSDIVIDQQNRVFDKSESTWRKVIISTSIAESSITVPDVKYVIDFCLTKELYCDPFTHYTHLRVEWASISNMDQRRGRAGRVSDGTCYRLVPRSFVDELEKFPTPAILREPLEKLILNVKRLNQSEEPKQILSMAIQPPKLNDIERTVLLLKEVGALTLKSKYSIDNEVSSPYDGDLTYVGSIMASLPIDVRLAKLILLGHAFGKLRETIIMAAGLSTKTFFTCYYKSHLESFKAKWVWSGGWMCDCLSILNAYNVYESHKENGAFDARGSAEKWAKKYMIELNRIREVEKLKIELTSRLVNLGINCNRHIKINQRGSNINSAQDLLYNIDDEEDYVRKNLILKMIIAGAFYPNYFNALPIDLQDSIKLVGGRDIYNTVQIKNLPNDEGVLYANKISEMFKICSKIVNVNFEDTKAYVEFKSKCEEVASNINLGVYLAVQMRLLRIPLQIKRFNGKITNEKLRIYKESCKSKPQMLSHSIDSKIGLKFNLSMSTSSLNSTMNDSQLGINDGDDDNDDANTIVGEANSSRNLSEDEDYGKFIEPDRYIQENKNKYLSILSLDKLKPLNVSNSRLNRVSSSSRLNSTSSDISTNLNRDASSMGSLVSLASNPKYILPAEVDQGKFINISITDIIECGRFWTQINDDHHLNTLFHIQTTLNSINPKYQLIPLNESEIFENALCVTYYVENTDIGKEFYRTRILSVNFKEEKADIQFIDYGNKVTRKLSELYRISEELMEYPFQAIECKILNIKPSLVKNPNSVWTKNSNDFFKKLIMNNDIYEHYKMKVLGLDETVVLINLFGIKDDSKNDISEVIIANEYAQKLSDMEIDMNLKKQKFSKQDYYYIPTRDKDYSSSRSKYSNINTDMKKLVVENKLVQQSSLINKNKYFDDDDSLIDDSASSIAESSIPSSYRGKREVLYDENDEKSYSGYIDLRGPYSPLECTYSSIINLGFSKRVRVERDSINYVTLDEDPANAAAHLLIAHEVTLNGEGNTMILRKTTQMPKLPGLSNICCLLFAPTIELRTDERETCYTGALCGLGYDDYNKAPIYTDNDIECVFDVKFDFKDLIMINAVRMVINMVIGSDEDVKTWTNSEHNLRDLQQKACNNLLKLISRNREIVEPKYFRKPQKWNQIEKEKLIEALPLEKSSSKTNAQTYYTYHKAVALSVPMSR